MARRVEYARVWRRFGAGARGECYPHLRRAAAAVGVGAPIVQSDGCMGDIWCFVVDDDASAHARCLERTTAAGRSGDAARLDSGFGLDGVP